MPVTAAMTDSQLSGRVCTGQYLPIVCVCMCFRVSHPHTHTGGFVYSLWVVMEGFYKDPLSFGIVVKKSIVFTTLLNSSIELKELFCFHDKFYIFFQ